MTARRPLPPRRPARAPQGGPAKATQAPTAREPRNSTAKARAEEHDDSPKPNRAEKPTANRAEKPKAKRAETSAPKQAARPAAERAERSAVTRPQSTADEGTPSRAVQQASKQGSADGKRPGVVQAADRFRAAVVGKPWRRRRRRILATAAVVVLVAAAALVAAIFVPQLQVQKVTVSGLTYVRESDVRAAVSDRMDTSMLLLPTSAVRDQVEAVPGVLSAKVEKSWPDGIRIAVREREPIATLTEPGGATSVLDATGEKLPAGAAEGKHLVPLTVGAGSSDPEGAVESMSAVLGSLPKELRDGATALTATSRSNVTLTLKLSDGAQKTVVWGDAEDAELKAKVVRALLDRPGTVIDVSSPVAPVTR